MSRISPKKDIDLLDYVFYELGFGYLKSMLKSKNIIVPQDLEKKLIDYSKITTIFLFDNSKKFIESNFYGKKHEIVVVKVDNKIKALAIYEIFKKKCDIKFLVSDQKNFFETKDIKPLKGVGTTALIAIMEECFINHQLDKINLIATSSAMEFYKKMGFKFECPDVEFDRSMILTVQRAACIYSHLLKTA
jgi:hypothetical protein